MADGIPLSFVETFLPLEIRKKIITNNLKVEPIFSLLERKYDVPLIEADYKLDAVAAEAEVAAAPKIKQRPVFRIVPLPRRISTRPRLTDPESRDKAVFSRELVADLQVSISDLAGEHRFDACIETSVMRTRHKNIIMSYGLT